MGIKFVRSQVAGRNTKVSNANKSHKEAYGKIEVG